ncbi:MAG TPA: T9SS type A sorting domain-containing protein [Bacteroidales bacterium]|nr:T9SS type A sorting domain-containing protein [Bacteroidales bacterium]
MKRHLIFVLLFLLTLAGYSQNLVINPGFESWDSDTRPTGWSTAQNCLADNSVVWEGNYSCHQAGTSSSKYLGQLIQVSAGTEYCLSLYYTTLITDNGNGCRIWCYWKDAEGSSLSDPLTDDILRPSQYLKSDDWDQFSVTVTAPEGAAALYLEVRTYPNSVAYWDNFSLTESVPTYAGAVKKELPVLYPNPVTDYLHISGINNIKRIAIYSYNGIKTWDASYEGQPVITIPAGKFSNGIYTVIIYTRDKAMYSKFLKKTP